MKKFLISCSDLCILATIMIGCDGRNLLSLGRFLLSCSICYVRFRYRTVSVCRFLLGELLKLIGNWCDKFLWSYHYCFAFVCTFGLLAFYSKFVTTFPTDSAGHNLTYRFNPVSVVISCFMHRLLRLVQLVSWLL